MEHIFAKWPSLAALASDLKKPYPTVASWKQRGSIPAEFDVMLVECASARGEALTFEEIARARAVPENTAGAAE